jgi:hypothetical protein
MKPSAPSWRLAKLTTAGLVATAVGFLGAAVNPGPGPRVVKHSLSLGPLYLGVPDGHRSGMVPAAAAADECL